MRPGVVACGLLLGLLAAADAAAAGPEQVHASWLGDGQLGVTWVRPGDVAAASQDVLRVQAGPASFEAPAGSVAYIAPGVTVHKATLAIGDDGWRQGVSYLVGSEAAGWSVPATLPAWPADGEPWRIVAYGDHGVGTQSNASALLVPTVAARQPHAVLHLGDIAYADGTPSVWDEWFRMVEPLAATTLYMATPGNHEHEGYHVASGPSPDQASFTGSALDAYEQYRQRFHLPGQGELHYSFDLGPVHVVSINSEDLCATQPATEPVPWRVSLPCGAENQLLPLEGDRPLPPNQELLDWLVADLVANADAPWTLVMLHRPVYSSGAYSGESVLRESFVPVFEEHGVDLVLSGHDHNYQRSFPLRAGAPDDPGLASYPQGSSPIYVVSGGAGEGYYSLRDPAPAWTASRTTAFHFLEIQAWPQGLRLTALDTFTGEALDSFTLGVVPSPSAADIGEGPEAPSPAWATVAAVLGSALAAAARRRVA